MQFLDRGPAPPLNGEMFGPPSLTKILVLALIVALVWGGFKVITRVQQARREEQERVVRAQTRPRMRNVEEMVRCSACGAYVAVGARHKCEPGGSPA